MSAGASERQARGKTYPPRPSPVPIVDLRQIGLTRRESEIMHWISEGKRDREIATILQLSPRTVGNHAHNIFQKLNVETRTAAVRHCALAISGLSVRAD